MADMLLFSGHQFRAFAEHVNPRGRPGAWEGRASWLNPEARPGPQPTFKRATAGKRP